MCNNLLINTMKITVKDFQRSYNTFLNTCVNYTKFVN